MKIEVASDALNPSSHQAATRVGNSQGCNGRGCRRPGWCTGWCTEAKASAEARDFLPNRPIYGEMKEPTSGLEPLTCSLGVCPLPLLWVAQGCKSRLDNGFSVPCIAHYCRVLRAG
jgi:hypothetical protein